MSSGQVSELLGQSETVPHMLRRHKVLSHLDTAVQVVHLRGEEQRMLMTEDSTDMNLESWNIQNDVIIIASSPSLTWCGAPAGMNTASPKNCTMAQPWTPYSS